MPSRRNAFDRVECKKDGSTLRCAYSNGGKVVRETTVPLDQRPRDDVPVGPSFYLDFRKASDISIIVTATLISIDALIILLYIFRGECWELLSTLVVTGTGAILVTLATKVKLTGEEAAVLRRVRLATDRQYKSFLPWFTIFLMLASLVFWTLSSLK